MSLIQIFVLIQRLENLIGDGAKIEISVTDFGGLVFSICWNNLNYRMRKAFPLHAIQQVAYEDIIFDQLVAEAKYRLELLLREKHSADIL